MRFESALTAMMIAAAMILFTGCGEEGADETAYIADETAYIDENSVECLECRANLRTIASQEVVFFAENDRYTSSMEELGLGNTHCPSGGGYRLTADGEHISITCPEGHGSVDDGIVSWR